MRIVFLMTGISYGGAAKSLTFLLKSIKNFSKIESFVFTQFSNAPEIEKQIKENCDGYYIINFPHINSNQAYSTDISEFNKIINSNHDFFLKEILKLDPDIIHLNSTTLVYLAPLLKLKNKDIKIVLHIREMMKNPNDCMISDYLRKCINYTDYSVAISPNEIESIPGLYNFEILPNPIDFEETETFEINKKVRDNENTITIGMMSSFHPSKGHIAFIKAISIIKKRTSKNITCIILGIKEPKLNIKTFIRKLIGREFKSKLDDLIKLLNLERDISLYPPSNDVYDFLNKLDIYVRPSEAGDPWGRDIIEAMAMRKPIVATGTSEFFIENDKTGFLVPTSSSEVLAERIVYLIENEELRKKFGERGYEKIKMMCNLNDYGKKINTIYEKLLKLSLK